MRTVGKERDPGEEEKKEYKKEKGWKERKEINNGNE